MLHICLFSELHHITSYYLLLYLQQKQLDEEKKRAKENRPYLQYYGKTVYATNFIDCAIACDSLL